MELTIAGPSHKRVLLAAWFETYTTRGNLIIQPGHAPLIAILAPHKPLIVCLKNGKQESLIIAGGILEVNRNHALILMNE